MESTLVTTQSQTRNKAGGNHNSEIQTQNPQKPPTAFRPLTNQACGRTQNPSFAAFSGWPDFAEMRASICGALRMVDGGRDATRNGNGSKRSP
jgi:hypothetical protein